MSNDKARYNLRRFDVEVSEDFEDIPDVYIDYNGGPEEYEDPADYIRVKAVRLG